MEFEKARKKNSNLFSNKKLFSPTLYVSGEFVIINLIGGEVVSSMDDLRGGMFLRLLRKGSLFSVKVLAYGRPSAVARNIPMDCLPLRPPLFLFPVF